MHRARTHYLTAIAAGIGVTFFMPAVPGVCDLYPEPSRASADLADALRTAVASHRRVIVDFGGNWCTDCHVLEAYLHDPANQPLLEENFVLVHVNVGRMDRNLDIAAQYRIPVKKGVPALAVLEADGRILYSQSGGEFENMRGMRDAAVTAFLIRWKPDA